MTVPTRTHPTRRTLAVKATRPEADRSADAWDNLLGPLADVRVVVWGAGTTEAMPFAVTARKPDKRGGGS